MAALETIQASQPGPKQSLRLLSEHEANAEVAKERNPRDWNRRKFRFLEGTTLLSVYDQNVSADNLVRGDPAIDERLLVFIPGLGEAMYKQMRNGVTCKFL